jgi:DDE superfamily endonuclease
MSERLPCPLAPGPLEEYAAHFDPLFCKLGQRRSFRAYLEGLLLPRERNKTLTGLAGAEPIVQAQVGPVQRLQFFLSEARWDAEALNAQRLALLRADAATAPTAEGVLVIDETGDRKDGTKTAHVARQYLGSLGKVANGIVAVSSLWADERVYYPLHLAPYTPAQRLPRDKSDTAFRTKPQIAAALVRTARAAGIPFRAVVADCIYGESPDFTQALWAVDVPYVLSLRPSRGSWGPADAAHTPHEAAQELAWDSPEQPGAWTRVSRRFRDGHEEVWWAADLTLGGWGPDRPARLVVASTDPASLPAASTWYLETNLPRPGSPLVATAPFAPADLAEVVRLYGLRQWVEQSYKQVKHELGWADFQVRADRAIRRHWQLVCCAFSFCWWAFLRQDPDERSLPHRLLDTAPDRPASEPLPAQHDAAAATAVGGKWGPHRTARQRLPCPTAGALLAASAPRRAQLARPLGDALALLAGVVQCAPATSAPGSP